eukprot:4207124-Amphidinium_carterae.1
MACQGRCPDRLEQSWEVISHQVWSASSRTPGQPMRAIETLATQIRLKQFDPDATRSGRWLSMSPAVVQTDLTHMPEGDQPGHDESLSSSSSEASESEAAEEIDKRLVPDAQ